MNHIFKHLYSLICVFVTHLATGFFLEQKQNGNRLEKSFFFIQKTKMK